MLTAMHPAPLILILEVDIAFLGALEKIESKPYSLGNAFIMKCKYINRGEYEKKTSL